MENAILELTRTLQEMNGEFDWSSTILAVCSVISLIAIGLLLKERYERKRPYLQVSFELVKSSLVCLVIRNVGETPARLNEILFDRSFVKQLPTNGQKHASDRTGLNISIYPNQKWVMCLDVITPDVLEYQNTVLEITLAYTAKGQKKIYREHEKINFNDYSGFLVYISQMDELTDEVKTLGKSLERVSKTLNQLTNTNTTGAKVVKYANLSDTNKKTQIIGYSDATILRAEENPDDKQT